MLCGRSVPVVSVFFGLCLALTLVPSLAYVYPCTHKSSSGDFYDLSPLTKCDLSGYTVGSGGGDDQFQVNICQEVDDCGGQEAVCQADNFKAGLASQGSFSDLPGAGKGLVLTYGGGDGAGCPHPRTSIFTFNCDPAATTPVFTYLGEKPQCTYSFQVRSSVACPVQQAPQRQVCPINVWLVPHTHDDVGWLQTIDGYYQSAVKHILDTVVASLVANPSRKFMYVEQAFFWRWWTDPNTSDTQRSQLKTLVQNGQFEFVLGGWTMPDEACTTFGAEVDQLTLGHQFIYNTFNFRPTKGWQIDPFGASSVTPTLSKLAGFDVQLIDRTTNKGEMEANQRLQFVWQGSPSLGKKSEIFGEIMGGGANGYCDWFFSFDFEKDPVNAGNVAQYATTFVNMVNARKGWYKTPNILAQWGCDFAFQNATPMFNSMDKLVAQLQATQDTTHVFVKYATLSEYWQAVFQAVNNNFGEFPVNIGGDFFDYDDSLWWSGYFTSRVQLKGIVRRGEATARAMETLYSIGRASGVAPDTSGTAANQLTPLRLANADATHHDGVTGTSVPEVVSMYENDILNGAQAAGTVGAGVLSAFLGQKTLEGDVAAGPALTTSVDALLNFKNGTIPLVLYNSLGWTRHDIINLPINRNDVRVYDAANRPVVFQVNQNFDVDEFNVTSTYRLFFQASLPALSYVTYFVVSGSSDPEAIPVSEVWSGLEDTTFSNNVLAVTLSSSTGRISNVINKVDGVAVDLDLDIARYISLHSGAYAFTPKGNAAPLSAQQPKTTIVKGPIVTEIYQEFVCDGSASSFIKQSIRIVQANASADVQAALCVHFKLGVLPSHHEIVSVVRTSVQSAGVFATDSNGFEMQQRKYVYDLGIQGNYFPMVYAAYIRDRHSQVAFIAERSHGAASLVPGELECMVHRNPDMGDGFGPGLTDTDIVRPALRVLVSAPSSVGLHRHSYLHNFPVQVFVAPSVQSVASFTSAYTSSGQFMAADLPSNVHLLSFAYLQTNQFIVRLTHLFAVDEDESLAVPVTVDLSKLFPKMQVKTITETTLSATKQIVGPAPSQVVLSPKEIRTFVVTF